MIMKSLIVVHRYVGVVLGVIMTLWCISGFVMMYKGFPETSQAERLAGLAPLDLAACCAELPIEPDASAGGLRIEMLNGDTVLRLGREAAYSLKSGMPVSVLDEAGARGVAQSFASGNGIAGEIAKIERHASRSNRCVRTTTNRIQPMAAVSPSKIRIENRMLL